MNPSGFVALTSESEAVMPRFYFHIRRGVETVTDLEGVELPGPKAAFKEAQDAAREILAAKVRKGGVIDGDRFDVYDDLENLVFTVPFKSVLKFD